MKKEEKFNQIVAENSERIKRICAYYSSNTHDPKDIYQEVLINIWKSLDSFRGDSAISTWIYRIAVNTTLSYVGNAYKYMKLMVRADTQNLGVLFDEESIETCVKKLCPEFSDIKVQLIERSGLPLVMSTILEDELHIKLDLL